MNIVDYTSLVTAVGNWTHRADLTAQIPDFIGMAEYRVARDLRINPLINTGSVVVSAGATDGVLPTGSIEVVAAATSATELKYITPDTFERSKFNANGVTSPLFYTIQGGNIRVSPAWSAGGNVTVTFFKKETALSGSNTTNWYVLNAPDLLLYACLLEAAPYLKDVADSGMWKTYYEYARDRVNEQYGVVDAYARMMAWNSGKARATAPAV